MKKTIFLVVLLVSFSYTNKAQTVTDIDGNVYNILTIGSQQWLGENLKATHYRNGDPIPNVPGGTAWENLTTGAYCNYQDDTINATVYGRLYNWLAVNDSRIIAPVGWHIPTDTEFTILIDYLGGDSIAGGKLKEIGFEHWCYPNAGATNETGFTAVPGGYCNSLGVFDNKGYRGYYQSSTVYNAGNSWFRELVCEDDRVDRHYASKGSGHSVRCVKDNITGTDNLNEYNEIKIYPNPMIDKINIDFTYKPQSSILLVYNRIGKIILQKSLDQKENVININSLPKGLFIVEISNSKAISRKKLIKQ
jgi:uncharacterized protein (TIGR02145 family)